MLNKFVKNEKAIFEIGNIIHIRKDWKFQNLSAEEIIKSIEYQKEFKVKYPELSKLAERKIKI